MSRKMVRTCLALCIVLVGIQVISSAGQQPPPQDGLILQHETFSDSTNTTWRIWEGEKSKGWIYNGEYYILIKARNWYVPVYTHDGLFNNFRVDVDARQVAGPDQNRYGVVFRREGRDNFYNFYITGDGYICFRKQQNGDWVAISGKQACAAVNKEQSSNHITVTANGSRFTFLVNDIEVLRATDNSFTTGDIGAMASTYDDTGVVVAFDNFEVRSLSDECSVLLQVPYYAAPSDALPWCAPSSLAMLLSYYGEPFKHPHDVASELQTPRSELTRDILRWMVSGMIQVGRGLVEAWNDIFGAGCFSSIAFDPQTVKKWLDNDDPILVCARGIAHDFLVIGYREREDMDDPILYVHDSTGYLTEDLLDKKGKIGVQVPFSTVLAQYRKAGRANSEALVYTCGQRTPRPLSIFLSEYVEDNYVAQIHYTTSAELFCASEGPCALEGDWASFAAPMTHLFFDSGLKWENAGLSFHTEDDLLRIPCSHWSLRLYTVVANSSDAPQTANVWIVIQARSGDHTVFHNRKLATVTVKAFGSERVFLGDLHWSDLDKPLPYHEIYDLFIVLRDVETNSNIDWTQFRIQRE